MATALNFTPEFLEKYSGLEPLGAGGMGTVYRGIQRSLERPVAIKFLSRQLLDDEYLARFTAEARLAGQVFHTNLVAVIEFGVMADVPYIVFELVEGASLREHVKRAGGQIGLAQALDIVRQAAEGLAVAHGIGIIHRDIKPENLLVGSKGVKVADFGVAKSAGANPSQKTRSGVIMGTPAYMSPEQAREQPVTPASDVYALGVVLYELVSGQLPFQKQSTLELLQAIVSEPPPVLPSHVPGPVADLVARMLAKDPAGRPASMEACARELAHCAAQLGSDAPVMSVFSEMQATRPVSGFAPSANAQTVVSQAAPAARPRGRLALAVGAAVALLFGAWGVSARFEPPPPPPPSPTPTPGPAVVSETEGEPMSGLDHDVVMQRFCASKPRADETRLCKAWDHLLRHDVVAASRDLFEKQRLAMPSINSVRRNFREGMMPSGGMRNLRVFERLVTELFALPRAEGLKVAAEIDTIGSAALLGSPLSGLADLATGGPRAAHAFANLKGLTAGALLGVLAKSPHGSAISVMIALALAAGLPAGWAADPGTMARVAIAQDECEAYLKIWVRGELRPVAASLAAGFAQARGRAADPRTDMSDLDPVLKARVGPRLEALVKIARTHIAAGKPGSTLAPDPEY